MPAAAQTTSNIEGTVKDARGAVVPGAEVKAASPVLAVTRSTTTDENGFYRITALAAGNYSVTVTATGFATSTISDVELTLNRTLALDIQLEVG
ncbi:MAG TPA: carboxypeptidase-like regulatory domain-containing protein, partial [Pyrinomonadaceae bacterium]|nr:carboxypeptidase-like regulatory domain-containing protein [Pyrinomonadaceae bacterium]